MILILSCEHGGNEIPLAYKPLFEGKKNLLETHRGYDPGTLNLFEYLKETAHFSKCNTISRLLIECNRSLHHPKLFSEITKSCDTKIKQHIINTYYLPYRLAIEAEIVKEIRKGTKVVHLSLHSFTPQLNGELRNNDIGLLYNPKSILEKEFCKSFKFQLEKRNPNLKIRYNYPYLGTADGFPTYLRKKFKTNYLGIELEINQKLLIAEKFPEELKLQIKQTLKKIIC